MASSEKIWIALIDKATYGPLTTEEVSLLFSQKILKHNDFLLNTQEEKPEWKFVWQYSLFDRRNETKSPPNEEKRVSKPVAVPVTTLLPEEIRNIAIEDVVLHSRQLNSEVREPESSLADRSVESFVAMTAPIRRSLFLLPLGGFIAIAIYSSSFFSPANRPVPREVSQQNGRLESSSSKLSEASPLSNVVPLVTAKQRKITPPQPDNRGENANTDLVAEEIIQEEEAPLDEFEKTGRDLEKKKSKRKKKQALAEDESAESVDRELSEEAQNEEEAVEDSGEIE